MSGRFKLFSGCPHPKGVAVAGIINSILGGYSLVWPDPSKRRIWPRETKVGRWGFDLHTFMIFPCQSGP